MGRRKPSEAGERELQVFVNKRPKTLERDGGLSEADYYGKLFRQCWKANTPAERDSANLILEQILSQDVHRLDRVRALQALGKDRFPVNVVPRPVLSVDLTGAGFRLQARDYFDEMALALIAARRRLGICLAEECQHRYFISKFPRQHYCSDKCLAQGRRASKRKWAKYHYKSANPDDFGIRGNAPQI